jgi:hypothetical protein
MIQCCRVWLPAGPFWKQKSAHFAFEQLATAGILYLAVDIYTLSVDQALIVITLLLTVRSHFQWQEEYICF